MDYKRFLEERAKNGIVLGLSSMRSLMKKLGNPQDRLKIIHISGTNGKGSVGAFLEGILQTADLTVARYTSPAVFSDFEKYTINSEPISEEDFCLCAYEVAKACFDGENPTLFETETAIAFLYFAKKGCDIAIIETGMGGQDDATNIIKKPLCSVITSISKDHIGFLGTTLEEIAQKKSGIIKEGSAVFSAEQDKNVQMILKEAAKKKDTPITFAHESNFLHFDGKRQFFDYGEIKNLSLSALGLYQLKNASLAIEVAKALGNFSPQAIKKGLENVIWQGRFEIIAQKPLFIIDGAHNEAATLALKETIQAYFPEENINFITGVFADKEHNKIAQILAPLAKKIFAISSNQSRSLEVFQYQKELLDYNDAVYASTTEEAVQLCMHDTDAITICFGSLSILAKIKSEVKKYEHKHGKSE